MGLYFNKIPGVVRRILPKAGWKGPRQAGEKTIYLTFDDGPHCHSTHGLLDLLASVDVPASFFLTGSRLDEDEGSLSQIRDRGHRIGNHGYCHRDPIKQSMADFVENVERGRAATASGLFRPPFGRMGLRQYRWVSKSQKLWMWTVMPGDFDRDVDSKRIQQNIVDHAEDGSIIVLHDRPDCVAKLKPVFPETVDQLRTKGFLFKTLPI